MPARPLLTDLSRDQLIDWFRRRGDQAFRADQVRKWIFGKRVESCAEMHDVPLAARTALETEYRLFEADWSAA